MSRLGNFYTRLRAIPFIESNLKMGPMTAIRFVTGPVRSKASALLLGTAGIGYLGTGLQGQTLGVTLGSLSMGQGITGNLCQALAQNDPARRKRVMATAFTMQLAVNALLVAGGIIFARPVAGAIFGNPNTDSLLIPLLFSVPWISFNNAYFVGILYSHGRYELFSRVAAVQAVLDLTAFVIGARFFGLRGAFATIPLCSLVWFLMLARQVCKVERARDVFRLGFDRTIAADLLNTGGAMLTAGTITYGLNLVLRAWILRFLDASHNGLYQVTLTASAYYMPFLTLGIWARLFPKVSRQGLDSECFTEWGQSLLVIMVFAPTLQLALMIAPELPISLFYTKQFLPAALFLPLQLAGDLMYLTAQPCLGAILGLNRRGLYLGIWILGHGAWAITAWLLLPRIGVMGVPIGYVVANAIIAGCGLVSVMRRAPDAPARALSRRVLTQLAYAIVAVGLQVHLSLHSDARAPRVAVFAAWITLIALQRRVANGQFVPRVRGFIERWYVSLPSGLSERDHPEARGPSAFAEVRPAPALPVREAHSGFPLLLNGEAVQARYLRASTHGALSTALSAAPASDLDLLADDAAAPPEAREALACELSRQGFSALKLVSFAHEVGSRAAAGAPDGERRPLVLDDCLCQNDYALLARERERAPAGLVTCENQGNLIWGWVTAGRDGARELQVGGLVLNKPHFWRALTETLSRQHDVRRLRGRLPASSPLAGVLNAQETSPVAETLWIKWARELRGPAEGVPLHLFL